ncbi:MAG: UDP-N-acetylmuramoyl-tripeptide--D-alanyl-D-alanine ligase [Gemmatimonadetes bacterium]|nr:UDP-N-acetylmuramoyl-tripeptide--D-alanyl-D-alanine ligase [Gemmatimonadota bacterium]
MTVRRWSERQVIEALGLEEEAGDGDYSAVSTDTRSIGPGDLFVALVGDRFDAHDFLAGAAESGASAAVVERIPGDAPAGMRYFVVDDSLHALGRLANYRRRRLGAKVAGVVGSNGKTTTKDLLRVTLSARFRVHATEGNLNNQIGVPLTLLRTPEDAEALVIEMGTNEPGEIAILARIAEPDAAVITSIGEEHLEKLVDLDGVLEEETSILAGIRGGIVIVAEEPDALAERARGQLGAGRVRVAGFSEAADLRPEGGSAGVEFMPDGSTRWRWEGHGVHLPLPGRYNVRNALLALGLASEWGVPAGDAAAALQRVPAPKLRGEWKRVGDLRVLADCYNSNPPSVAAAIEVLMSVPADGRKIAVLGTMRELGASSEMLHRRTAEAAARSLGEGIDLIVATGDFVPAFAGLAGDLGEALLLVEEPIAAFERVRPHLRGDEVILLKASRGEELERWLPLLSEIEVAG